ncbi:agip54 [Agrotis ipsilon multiple nucleopolyhedrovirus]|uniref:Polyhedral envelope protein n=1 Tax=Agrotis ipsilon multiple nucleopolyhedrovirus TaxID=208013 RepID=B6D5W8_9ABAC|nr:agip54 [Agrotis ipsilon multiple nucleopolyhedrovirus]ACI28756.1 polyhedral envelope protein [Agrotis ipsilon multiple nucleopolyhedrovirus]
MSLISKKCQDINVSAFLDQFCVLWVSADDVLHLLRLPSSVLQTIQQRHKKCWVDFRCPTHCSHDATKLFVDLYGLGNLCNRVNSQIADYLMTLFVAEVYAEQGSNNRRSPPPRCRSPSPRRRSPSPRRRSPSPRRRSLSPRRRHRSRSRCRSRSRRRSVSPRRGSRSRSRHRSVSPRRRSLSPRRRSRSHSPRCCPRPRCCPKPKCCWHHKHHTDLLERIARQNDQVVVTLNQLTVTNANQHLELSNLLNAIRLQNVTIGGQIAQILDAVQGLGDVGGDFTQLLSEIDTRLAALSASLLAAINQLAEQVRNDLSGINAVLNNLSSSVTNINATLNNLLQAVNGINLNEVIGELQQTVNTILELLQTILNILQPINRK